MKALAASAEQRRETMGFVILKSYDGGKKWERERRCPDYTTAAGLAQALRVRHPCIRFRVEVESAGHRRQGRSQRPGGVRSP